jgi:undecaprenyl-diphosphatase
MPVKVDGRSLAGPLVCAFLSAVLFVVLAQLVLSGEAAAFDEFVRSAINVWASDLLTALAFGLSRLGSSAVIAILLGVAAVGFWVIGRRRRSAVMLVLFMAGAVVLESGLKLSFQRARPEAFFGALPTSFSFPSGHALLSLCFYAALAGFLSACWRRSARVATWLAAVLLVLGIGLSRIYLGVHHPTDVIGGYLAALCWTSLSWTWLYDTRIVQRSCETKRRSSRWRGSLHLLPRRVRLSCLSFPSPARDRHKKS